MAAAEGVAVPVPVAGGDDDNDDANDESEQPGGD